MSGLASRLVGEVVVAEFGDDDNLLTPGLLQDLLDLLAEIHRGQMGRGLVTTGTGKNYSTGLDLANIGPPGRALSTLRLLERVYASLLTLPVPTAAALPGHAFAGGAMLALAHDTTVMRADRGFWCLPEASLGLPLSEGMTALVASRLPRHVAHDVIVTGSRLAGPTAVTAGVVDLSTAAGEVLPAALSRVRDRAHTAGPALGVMKRQLHRAAVELLEAGPARMPAVAHW